MFGCAPLFLAPISESWGRNPVYYTSAIVFFLAIIPQARRCSALVSMSSMIHSCTLQWPPISPSSWCFDSSPDLEDQPLFPSLAVNWPTCLKPTIAVSPWYVSLHGKLRRCGSPTVSGCFRLGRFRHDRFRTGHVWLCRVLHRVALCRLDFAWHDGHILYRRVPLHPRNSR